MSENNLKKYHHVIYCIKVSNLLLIICKSKKIYRNILITEKTDNQAKTRMFRVRLKEKKSHSKRFYVKGSRRFQTRWYQNRTYEKNSFNPVAITWVKISEKKVTFWCLPMNEDRDWVVQKMIRNGIKIACARPLGSRLEPRVPSCPWMVISGLFFFLNSINIFFSLARCIMDKNGSIVLPGVDLTEPSLKVAKSLGS